MEDTWTGNSLQFCIACNDKKNEEAEVKALLEYLYLDVKVRSPDEVSITADIQIMYEICPDQRTNQRKVGRRKDNVD